MLSTSMMVQNMPVGAGGNGTVNQWRRDGGWPVMIERDLGAFIAAGGDTAMVWFGWGYKPQILPDGAPSKYIQFCTGTHGRTAEGGGYSMLFATYSQAFVNPMRGAGRHVLTYMGDPGNDLVLAATRRRIKRAQIILENLAPCEDTEVVLDHCSKLGPEWVGRLRMVGEVTGHRVTLEGCPQRDGFDHLREFGSMVMYDSIDRPGPNGMTLDEIQRAGFPVVYVLIRPGDLRPGEDMATVCAAMQGRGFTVVTDFGSVVTS